MQIYLSFTFLICSFLSCAELCLVLLLHCRALLSFAWFCFAELRLALLRSALLCRLRLENLPASEKTNSTCSSGMAGLSSLAWPGPGLGQGPGQARSQAGVGRAQEKIYSRSSPCMQGVWRGEAPHQSLLSADEGTVGNCVHKLSARPIAVLTLGKAAAPSPPKRLLSHFPGPFLPTHLSPALPSL